MRKNSEYVLIWTCCFLFGACYASFLKYMGVEDYVTMTLVAVIGTVITIKAIDWVTSFVIRRWTRGVKRNH